MVKLGDEHSVRAARCISAPSCAWCDPRAATTFRGPTSATRSTAFSLQRPLAAARHRATRTAPARFYRPSALLSPRRASAPSRLRVYSAPHIVALSLCTHHCCPPTACVCVVASSRHSSLAYARAVAASAYRHRLARLVFLRRLAAQSPRFPCATPPPLLSSRRRPARAPTRVPSFLATRAHRARSTAPTARICPRATSSARPPRSRPSAGVR